MIAKQVLLVGLLALSRVAVDGFAGPPALSGALRAATTTCKLQPVPPAPPTVRHGGGGDGDGDGLVLISLDGSNLRALLNVWQWQRGGPLSGLTSGDSEYLQSLEGSRKASGSVRTDAETTPELRLLRRMARWANHPEGSPRRGSSSLLKDRPMGAYIGGKLEGLVLMSYELDSSTLQNALMHKHLMVVEAIAIAPEVPDLVAAKLQAGITQSVLQLGLFHSMRVVFEAVIDEDELSI